MVFNSPCLTDKKELINHKGMALFNKATKTANYMVLEGVLMKNKDAASSRDIQLICAEFSSIQVKTQADWMLLQSSYFNPQVPTGRVVVPTGRYVVPAGKVIIIVSPGRLSLVPTGRVLSPVKIYLEWDLTEADFELAQRLQVEVQREITIKERSRLFVELINRRKKHFAKLRAEEIRRKPPTKAQKRNQMSTYLKNVARYKHSQLKSKSYDEIQKLFDKEMKRVNTFVDMNSEQKIDEHVEVKKADQEEAEMKRHIKIVKDDEVAIDAIPLATKPPVIVEYKIDKDGRMGYFKLIRANGSSKRYSSMIKMLQGIDREDLETLWKLVKAKHKNTRPEEDYERVLWGYLKVMFEPDIKSKVWRNLQGYKVTVWKLFNNYRVHIIRFRNLHIFMLVEKRYPLTPITILNMLNKKLQADRWNEMCYQLLKLMTKQ
ncbi:hypothetical protein Tco_0011235 [Tanacetum coccineum]